MDYFLKQSLHVHVYLGVIKKICVQINIEIEMATFVFKDSTFSSSFTPGSKDVHESGMETEFELLIPPSTLEMVVATASKEGISNTSLFPLQKSHPLHI